jgi:rod shape-determining protein MreD
LSLIIGLAVFAFAALAQVSAVPEFSILGAQPNLVIALLVAWMAIRPRREALLLIPAAGLFLGLVDSKPLGLAMLALAPLVLLTEIRELKPVESEFLPAIAVMIMATLAYETTLLLTLTLTGEHVDWLASVLDVLVPATVASVLLLVPIYGIVRLLSQDLRRRPAL